MNNLLDYSAFLFSIEDCTRFYEEKHLASVYDGDHKHIDFFIEMEKKNERSNKPV